MVFLVFQGINLTGIFISASRNKFIKGSYCMTSTNFSGILLVIIKVFIIK